MTAHTPQQSQWQRGKSSRGSPEWLRRSVGGLCPHWRTFTALTDSGEPTQSYPGHSLFESLLSGRRCRAITTTTLKNSFLPPAVRSIYASLSTMWCVAYVFIYVIVQFLLFLVLLLFLVFTLTVLGTFNSINFKLKAEMLFFVFPHCASLFFFI